MNVKTEKVTLTLLNKCLDVVWNEDDSRYWEVNISYRVKALNGDTYGYHHVENRNEKPNMETDYPSRGQSFISTKTTLDTGISFSKFPR
jgi:hypothetical protein